MRSRLSTLTVIAALVAACAGCQTGPSSGALVTFAVADETFRVWLTSDERIEAAERARDGGPARIPVGRIVAGTEHNTGWSWHLEDVTFAELTIELCDGRPSDVEAAGPAYGGGQFCPWGATIVRIDRIP